MPHTDRNPKLLLRPHRSIHSNSTLNVQWKGCCLSSSLGSWVCYLTSKEKTEAGQENERACTFWSGMFAFLNSRDRLKTYSLTQNSFYREYFKKWAKRSLRSEWGRILASYKRRLFCTYCLLRINTCWVLSLSENKPRRAGDSIWWL